MIDPSVRAVLRSSYTIRRFFIIYGGVLAITLLVLWGSTACLENGSVIRIASTNFFSNFAAAVAIFMLTYGFYVSVTPSGLRDAEVLPLRSAEIADGIVDLQKNTSDYWFWGRSGSYLRAIVLPRLDELSRKERRHITLRIVIPDPTHPENALRYVAIKRSLGEPADTQTLAANVIATIAAAIIVSAQNPYLKVQIGLSATIPVLRYDLSNLGALITRDAVTLPAILVNANNPYFEMFRDAVENELAQARPVTCDLAAPAFQQPGQVSVAEVLAVIQGVSIEDEAVITKAEQLMTSRYHRYE